MAEIKQASLSVDNRELHIFLHSMRDKYLKNLGTITLLKIAKERDLERHERFIGFGSRKPHSLVGADECDLCL